MSTIDQTEQEERIKALYNGGQIAAAIVASQQLTETYPDNVFGWKALSTLYILQAQHAAAATALQQAIRITPDEFELHYNLGNEYLALHQPESAIISFNHSIRLNPHYAQAHSNLGNVLAATQQPEAAIASYRRAIEVQPDFVLAYYNLGNLLKQQQHYQEAIQSYCQALTLKPDFADALLNMGAALKELDQLSEAISCYRQALTFKPDYVEAHNNLGIALNAQGKAEEAIASYRQALGLKPDYAEVHNNLGNIYNERQDYEQAAEHYNKAIALNPNYAEAYNNLGGVLNHLGRHEDAIASYHQAITLKPADASIYSHLGVVLKEQGRYEEALSNYRQAIALKPDYAGAYNNLGDTFKELEQFEDAIASYRKAIELDPGLREAYNNLGDVQLRNQQIDAAITSFLKAIELDPEIADAHNNIGNSYQDLNQYDTAIKHYRQALEIEPDFYGFYSNLLFCANYHPDLSSEEIYAYYQEYEQRFARSLYSEWQPHTNDRDPKRRLKIAYVSPSFHHHACRHFLEPLLAHHDHAQFEIYAYAQIARDDDVTARYRSYADHWIPTRGMSDAALADRIRADGIDILIDVSGHTGENRLLTFARKPAPVSLHWLDFGYTTGLTAIDYYLTDVPTIPPGAEAYFAEQPWRLPTPAYAYRPAEGMGEVNALPALSKGHITFGTLTRAVRLNHKVIRSWTEILKAVPDAHLIINSGNFKSQEMQERIAEQFAAQGIGRERLEIGANSPPWDVLRQIDIGLDCYPHNSGTTLFEHLYMGNPFVTLANRPSVGRLGASILTGARHPEWIAETEAEYINKAVALAEDLPALSQIRSQLRQQLQHSPLMDEAGFTQAVEQAYRQMWQQWCQPE